MCTAKHGEKANFRTTMVCSKPTVPLSRPRFANTVVVIRCTNSLFHV